MIRASLTKTEGLYALENPRLRLSRWIIASGSIGLIRHWLASLPFFSRFSCRVCKTAADCSSRLILSAFWGLAGAVVNAFFLAKSLPESGDDSKNTPLLSRFRPPPDRKHRIDCDVIRMKLPRQKTSPSAWIDVDR